MGIFDSFLGKKKASDTSNDATILAERYRRVIDNAVAFAGMCRKIASGGKHRASCQIYYELRATATGLVDVYATHKVHDSDLLEFAHDKAMENNRSGVEYAYKKMIDEYKLTPADLISFPDASDFMEFLRGGIAGYNSCRRSGIDIEITQKVGSIQSANKKEALLVIEKAILNSYSEASARYFGATTLAIYC